MKYTVLVTKEAAVELEQAYHWLVAQTEQHAPSWYNGLLAAILSLEEMPGRCPFGRANDKTDRETRQLLYGDKRHGYLLFFEFAVTQWSLNIFATRHAVARRIE